MKTVPVGHIGGVFGWGLGANRKWTVSDAWFANAPRYHSGGMVGLRPDEVPAILQRGEEVLSKSDPRNVMNGGGAGGAPVVNLRSVLAVGDAEIANAMSGPSGEQVVLEILRRNLVTVRSMVRG